MMAPNKLTRKPPRAELRGQVLQSSKCSNARPGPVLRFDPALKISVQTNGATSEDAGTGTAYSNLLVFDLAIFRTTKLPVVVHDSFLFKNIENLAVANLVKIYRSFAKQSFIAIDEIKKYGKEGSEALEHYSVTRLSNEKVLYIKDWRK